MESFIAPTKPPRGVKNAKETSGHFLMTVIRTLSNSESNEERDKEKAKLEKDYQKCDKELDGLISQHDRELTQVMHTFARMSLLLNSSRAKIVTVKENLLACKTLLSCRRDELKKLWLEGIEHKHTLQLLDEISQVKQVPTQLSSHLEKKHYLHATQVLVSALALGSSTLEDVEALRELRSQLEMSKQHIYGKLLEELTRHIYIESTQELTAKLTRQGSMHERESTPGLGDRSKREFNTLTVTKRESFRSKKRIEFNNGLRSVELYVCKFYLMLEPGVVCPSKSAWSSPIILLDKPDRSKHFIVDFHKVNGVTKRDAYPLPQVTTIFDRHLDAKYLSSLDVNSAYGRIPILAESQEKTAFTIPGEDCGSRYINNSCFKRQQTDRMTYPKVIEDVDLLNPEEDSEHFMSILVECLGLLNKLSESIESLKINIQSELLNLVERTTNMLVATESVTPLLDLLVLLIEQFRAVVDAHKVVLDQIKKSARTHKVNVNVFELSDVWSRIQAVMQLLLTDYLDIQNSMSDAHQVPTSFSDQSSNISYYFARRRQATRSRNTPLFKFENSSHALSMSTMMKEHQPIVGFKRLIEHTQRQKILVCQPDPNNITLIFIPLSKFIEEIEQAMGCSSRNPCTLNAFISDYVKDTFIRQHHGKMATIVEEATKCQDAWKIPISQEKANELSLPRPLLQSTVLVEESMQDIHKLMEAMPSHAGTFLGVSVNVIHGYREICQAAYRGIVQPHTEDKRVCSAAWLNDEDISRFLKSLPNWTNLKSHVFLKNKSVKREDTVEEESPEDVRQRNIKEAEILASNLAEGGINSHEIISDVSQLKCLALLQESMEWFSWHIVQFTSQLQRVPSTHKLSSPQSNIPHISLTNVDGIPAVPEGTIIALENLAHEFEELANTCLLVLHLEVRVQCFYYLLPRECDGLNLNAHDPDPKVTELSRVLTSIDEAMTSNLQPRKSKYIFEGLGHLIAKILMSSSQYLETIDESSIQRICRNIFTLQQTLTNITMAREVALDHANQYYQLFYLSPEDILNQVLENGPKFSELEYMNAFQLIHRSQPHSDSSALQQHLQRLSDILGEVGVTV